VPLAAIVNSKSLRPAPLREWVPLTPGKLAGQQEEHQGDGRGCRGHSPVPQRGASDDVRLCRAGTDALRAYVQALPDIQQALHGSVPASGLATDLYEDEQQNARETRSHAQIMRDALAKVNWQEIAEALREE
jgi:hypothetical protein